MGANSDLFFSAKISNFPLDQKQPSGKSKILCCLPLARRLLTQVATTLMSTMPATITIVTSHQMQISAATTAARLPPSLAASVGRNYTAKEDERILLRPDISVVIPFPFVNDAFVSLSTDTLHFSSYVVYLFRNPEFIAILRNRIITPATQAVHFPSVQRIYFHLGTWQNGAVKRLRLATNPGTHKFGVCCDISTGSSCLINPTLESIIEDSRVNRRSTIRSGLLRYRYK